MDPGGTVTDGVGGAAGDAGATAVAWADCTGAGGETGATGGLTGRPVELAAPGAGWSLLAEIGFVF